MNRTANGNIDRDDDPKAREAQLRRRILDGIEQTLDEFERADRLRTTAERAALAHYAALLCRHARCRRAGRCRRKPCAVPSAPGAT